MFKDERGYTITLEDLMEEFKEIKEDGEHDEVTFEQYLAECLGKNGTLERI